MFKAANLDRTLRRLITHEAGHGRHLFKIVLAEVYTFASNLYRNLQSFAIELSFKRVVAIGNALNRHVSVLVGFGRIGLFAIKALTVHEADLGKRRRSFTGRHNLSRNCIARFGTAGAPTCRLGIAIATCRKAQAHRKS